MKDDMPTSANDKDANMWGMFVHLGIMAGYVVPVAGLLAPILIWQLKKDEYPIVDQHGKVVVNWILSSLIYIAISIPLMLIVVGVFLAAAVGIASVVFAIIGGLKANSGEVWPYPGSIAFFK
ncbi:MAG: DUF4870 domain-containing protein [Planctomycetota bacterium]